MPLRRNILITGASSGLGAGMARRFSAMGRSLYLCARRESRLQTLQQELLSARPDARVLIQPLDVRDHAQVFIRFEQAAAQLGGIDRIIVNAGIARGGPLGAGHFRENLSTVETNFTAALAQCEAGLQIFRRQGSGHLVLISSVAADVSLPYAYTSYSASKAALSALGHGLRASLVHTGIRVSVIQPGFIDTEMTANAPLTPFSLSVERGSELLVAAIESEKARAVVPRWPWQALIPLLRRLPAPLASLMH